MRDKKERKTNKLTKNKNIKLVEELLKKYRAR